MVHRLKRKKVISFIFILLITVISNDTFLFGSNSNETMTAIPRYGLVLLVILLGIILLYKKKIYIRRLTVALIMLLLILISCLKNNVSMSLLVIKISILLAGFLFCQYYDLKKWSTCYREVMLFLSICSIIMTLLAYLAPSIIMFLPVATNTGGINLYVGFFSGIYDFSLNTAFIRCPGVFWEPGVYQIYLNIAILLTLYSDTRYKVKEITIYLIALLFTFSTTGFIAVAWIFITYVFFCNNTIKKRSDTQNILLFCILTIAVISVLLLHNSELFSYIFGKINRTNGSYIARLAGFVINYEIALENPIYGFGPDMGKMAEEFFTRSSASTIVLGWTRHNTNTLMYQFAAFGILFGVIYSIGIFNFGRYFARNIFQYLSIFGTFIIMYTGENLFSSIFPYIIVFYGLNSFDNTVSRYINLNKHHKNGIVYFINDDAID